MAIRERPISSERSWLCGSLGGAVIAQLLLEPLTPEPGGASVEMPPPQEDEAARVAAIASE
jgi:hypothetical protein